MSEIEQMRVGEWISREEHLIASRLFKVRTKLGIDRSELAFTAGISESELVRYENAIEPIPACVLVLLSSLMGVSIDYFFDSELEVIGADVYMTKEDEQPVLLS